MGSLGVFIRQCQEQRQWLAFWQIKFAGLLTTYMWCVKLEAHATLVEECMLAQCRPFIGLAS